MRRYPIVSHLNHATELTLLPIQQVISLHSHVQFTLLCLRKIRKDF